MLRRLIRSPYHVFSWCCRYVAAFCAGFEGGLSGEDAADDGPRVSFMQSDGGLAAMDSFSGEHTSRVVGFGSWPMYCLDRGR